MKPKTESRYYYYLIDDGRGYRIHRRPDNAEMETAYLRTKAAAEKEAKKRLRYFEQKEAA